MLLALGILPQYTATCNDGALVVNLPSGWWGGGHDCEDDDDCEGDWGWFSFGGGCEDCD